MIEIEKKDLLLHIGFREPFHSINRDEQVLTVEEGDGGAWLAIRDKDGSPITELTIAKDDAARFAQAVLLSSGAASVKKSADVPDLSKPSYPSVPGKSK